MNNKGISSILLTAVFFFGGCNTTGCLDNQSALPLAALYSSDTGQTISVSNIEISGVDVPSGEALVTGGKTISEVYLPMRSTHPSTSWCFHYTQEGIDAPEYNDTITFDYTSEPFFASEECGAMYNYNITRCRYTEHLIDSVVVADSLITNVDLVRIRIYMRTQNSDETER